MSSRRIRPRLWMVFFAVGALILVLPLVAAWGLSAYQSVLVRRTEGDLLTQGVLVSAMFADARARPSAPGGDAAGSPEPSDTGEAPRFLPLSPHLDLSRDAMLPPPSPGTPGPPAADVDAAAGQALSGVLHDAQERTLTGVRVMDRHGIVVGSSRGDLGLDLSAREEVAGALAGRVESRLRQREISEPTPELGSASRRSQFRVVVAMPVFSKPREGLGEVVGVVLLARTPEDLAETLHAHQQAVVVSALSVLAVLGLVSAVTARFVAWPVRQLLARTERVAAGDLSAAQPLQHAGTQEIADLSEAVSRMARALEARNAALRDYAAHVSHEFKTPLASMRGAAELLREHGDSMTPAERGRFLGNLEADVERLSRLLSGLLELTRAETAPRAIARMDARVTLERLAGQHSTPTAPIGLALADGPLPVQISPEALESAVGNLLQNAVQHGGPSAHVSLAARSEGTSRLVIEVRDDGPGISEANLPRVFEPLFTTARATGGTGLGLPIVRALALAHGGRVDVTSRPGATTFRLEMPS